jgi:hypothetical protein
MDIFPALISYLIRFTSRIRCENINTIIFWISINTSKGYTQSFYAYALTNFLETTENCAEMLRQFSVESQRDRP